jgi:hypothetical protein
VRSNGGLGFDYLFLEFGLFRLLTCLCYELGVLLISLTYSSRTAFYNNDRNDWHLSQ